MLTFVMSIQEGTWKNNFPYSVISNYFKLLQVFKPAFQPNHTATTTCVFLINKHRLLYKVISLFLQRDNLHYFHLQQLTVATLISKQPYSVTTVLVHFPICDFISKIHSFNLFPPLSLNFCSILTELKLISKVTAVFKTLAKVMKNLMQLKILNLFLYMLSGYKLHHIKDLHRNHFNLYQCFFNAITY